MYIYKNNGNIIEAYELIAKAQEIIKYRKEKLQLIPEDEQIKEAYCRGWITPPFDKQAVDDIKIYDYKKYDIFEAGEEPTMFYHFLRNMDHDIPFTKSLFNGHLNCYYKGDFINRPVIRMQYENGMKYFLLTEDSYTSLCSITSEKSMPYIIQLPKCLYLLQLLENGRHFLIKKDDDINEQLDLFDINYIDKFSKNTLVKMNKCGMLRSDAIASAILNSGNDILHRVRK